MTHNNMRAALYDSFGEPDALEVRQVPKPSPSPTEVLVRVISAGLNPIDTQTRAGQGFTHLLGEPPFTPGWDLAGIVEQVGYGVTALRIGDPVFGMPRFPWAAGTHAEYAVAPSRQLAIKPENVTFEEAGAAPLAALTAHQVLHDAARVRRGSAVLIHGGAGGVGHLGVQIAAREVGATVVASCRLARAEWLKDLGAAMTMDFRNDRASDLSVLADVDAAIDLVGHEPTSIDIVGRMPRGAIFVGVADGISRAVFLAAKSRGVETCDFLVEPDARSLAHVAELLNTRRVEVHVDGVFDLADVVDAHRTQEGGHVQGKLVLRI